MKSALLKLLNAIARLIGKSSFHEKPRFEVPREQPDAPGSSLSQDDRKANLMGDRASAPMCFTDEYSAAIRACEKQLKDEKKRIRQARLAEESFWNGTTGLLAFLFFIAVIIWMGAKLVDSLP